MVQHFYPFPRGVMFKWDLQNLEVCGVTKALAFKMMVHEQWSAYHSAPLKKLNRVLSVHILILPLKEYHKPLRPILSQTVPVVFKPPKKHRRLFRKDPPHTWPMRPPRCCWSCRRKRKMAQDPKNNPTFRQFSKDILRFFLKGNIKIRNYIIRLAFSKWV